MDKVYRFKKIGTAEIANIVAPNSREALLKLRDKKGWEKEEVSIQEIRRGV